LLLLLLFALLALWLLVFVVATPEVFLLPLLFMTTAVFEETVLALVFAGMLTFVSTMPFLFGEALLLVALFAFPLLPLFVLSPPPQPASRAAPARTTEKAIFLRIDSSINMLLYVASNPGDVNSAPGLLTSETFTKDRRP
jgi:hypothetical protein